MPGGVTQVRLCTDALVGLAKTEGVTVLMTGHVTKDGDLAGPRTLEHAVDVVLSFEGEPRSGLRFLAGGRTGSGRRARSPGSRWGRRASPRPTRVNTWRRVRTSPAPALALPVAGRRALAVEVQALAVETQGPPRRQATGLDPRRFALVAAVLDQSLRLGLGGRSCTGPGRRAPGGRPGLRPRRRRRAGLVGHRPATAGPVGVRRRGRPHRRCGPRRGWPTGCRRPRAAPVFFTSVFAPGPAEGRSGRGLMIAHSVAAARPP